MTFTLKLSQDEMENMTMLEQAIEKYVDSLGMDGLIDYVTSDLLMKCGSRPALALLWSVYSKAADGDIDEFIEQIVFESMAQAQDFMLLIISAE